MSQPRPSGLRAAFGHEPFGSERLDLSSPKALKAELLKPNRVSICCKYSGKNTLACLRIEAPRFLSIKKTRKIFIFDKSLEIN